MNGSQEGTHCRVLWEMIKKGRGKTSESTEGKSPIHYVVIYCNIGVIEDIFNTSFSSWGDAWLLDIGATSHMKFQRDFFEDFDDNDVQMA
jgi:hypothetical protein